MQSGAFSLLIKQNRALRRHDAKNDITSFAARQIARGFHEYSLPKAMAPQQEGQSSNSLLGSDLLQKVLHGVSVAANVSETQTKQVSSIFVRHSRSAKTAREWYYAFECGLEVRDDGSRQIANMTLGIALLVAKSQQSENTSAHELAFIWSLIRNAVKSQMMRNANLKVNRSAQGFLAVPLCSVIVDGNIDLLFRLHVWLPDGQRGAAGFEIHSHQPFAQSWVLAGHGKDHTYEVRPVPTSELATHSRYALAWSSGAGIDSGYKTQQTYSRVVNTGDFMLAKRNHTAVHFRNMSYSVPAASFHSSEVVPDMLHATLFLFDGSQGFVPDAPVLGPAHSEHHTQVRYSPNVLPCNLATLVESTRQCEDFLAAADNHLIRSEWQQAFAMLEKAQMLCESEIDEVNMSHFQHLVAERLSVLLRSQKLRDYSEVAKWRYVYGRALLVTDQPDKALVQYNHYEGTTPTIAFCKSTSEQNRQRLQHLASAGADFELVDESGCTALDYTVMNDDRRAETIVLEALDRKLRERAGSDLHQRIREARLRKHFREIFEEYLRPMLIAGGSQVMAKIRGAYTEALSRDPAKARAFDLFKYVPYRDLAAAGSFPRSTDGLTRTYDPSSDSEKSFLFFSYRWASSNPWTQQPDNDENTQYLRTLQAVEDFLKLHPSVASEKLGIWVDFACIDQELPHSGVAALPLILAQCDAMISLVDCKYYDRAWCCVEAMIIRALQRSYKLHLWYEYRNDQPKNAEAPEKSASALLPGPTELQIALKDKLLSFEDDRPKILFLEKESRLLW